MIIAILLTGWILFSAGLFLQLPYLQGWKAVLLNFSSLFMVLLAAILWFRRRHWWPFLSRKMEDHTKTIDAFPDLRLGLWIALAAGLGLYVELIIIRLHASFFQLFAYFKNISLLSCFLGLGIGYARGKTRPLTTPLVMPLLALEIIFLGLLRFSGAGPLLQNPVSEQLALGLAQAEEASHFLTAYGFLALTFGFNALIFIPLGQLASRLMMRRRKLVAYSWNLIGSLLGVLLFALLSFLWTPPSIWILPAALAILPFLRKHISDILPTSVAVIVLLGFQGLSFYQNRFDFYSPYQILTLNIQRNLPPELRASNVFYQQILDLSEEGIRKKGTLKPWAEYFALPYHFRPRPERVLIVGSGTGNDVAAARRHGAGEIEAVEIDPAIIRLGKLLHPELPYQAENVNIVIDDARAFIRRTESRYDLIVYGLLDSHTLLSGVSGGVRLDSYVYTVEAFREARERLNAGGIMSLNFVLPSPELGRKLYLMLADAFSGQTPIVYQLEGRKCYAFLIGEGLEGKPTDHPPGVKEVTSVFAGDEIRAEKATDNWPFFYMPVRKYPVSYAAVILLLLLVSLLFVRQLVPEVGRGFSPACFFLGAGFMLLETKAITELALVYGSTWMVIGAVISAILVMIFLANVLVTRIDGLPRPVTYGMLFISIIAGIGLSSAHPDGLAPWLNRTLMTGLLTLPVFFSGCAFSTELKKAPSVAVALSSNLLGAMLGGFLEYNSMFFGFRALYFLALLMYGFALWGSFRAEKQVSGLH